MDMNYLKYTFISNIEQNKTIKQSSQLEITTKALTKTLEERDAFIVIKADSCSIIFRNSTLRNSLALIFYVGDRQESTGWI